MWWSAVETDRQVEAMLAGAVTAAALFAALLCKTRAGSPMTARLAGYPNEVAAALIGATARPWGGLAAEGLLTLLRLEEWPAHT